jgi:hypothetical protein
MSDVIKFNTETQAFGIVPGQFKCSGYGLAELIKDIPNPRGIEIGCDVGDTTEFLLKTHTKLMLDGVDPYENYVDWNGNNLNERQVVYDNFMQRVKPFGTRFNLFREYSDDAAKEIADEHYDFIFIDGLHTYEQLTKDCANYYSKVKTGGIFAGHDYNAIEGVRRAADEFAASVGKEILKTECDVWYWIK